MNVKIQGSGNGTYANTGSCVAVTNYLQHEDLERMKKGEEVQPFDDFCKVFDVVSRSIPHLAMNEAALQIAPITFSCSIALLIIGITFSATGVFQPKPPINTNAT